MVTSSVFSPRGRPAEATERCAGVASAGELATREPAGEEAAAAGRAGDVSVRPDDVAVTPTDVTWESGRGADRPNNPPHESQPRSHGTHQPHATRTDPSPTHSRHLAR